MAKAIEQTKTGLTFGRFGLGLYGATPGTVTQQVHDGDTVNVRALGNFSVRFLGIDTPEVSFTLPRIEDRLYVPADYLVLLEKSGWTPQH